MKIRLTLLFVFVALWVLSVESFADFGLGRGDTEFTVDTGAGLVFKVDKSNGNVTSWNYNGVEYRFDKSKRSSHINSGLGSQTNVTAEVIQRAFIKVTLQTSDENKVARNLTHYLLVKKGENVVSMATYVSSRLGRGELRWITRLWAPRIPNGPTPSDVRGNTGAIESGDVFGMSDGTTRSKYYGDQQTHGKDRAIDMTYCGAKGSGIGVWMVYGNRESSSGGPFFRDIQNQCGSAQEICNYLYSGHGQTEDWRENVLHGPYALVFTDGEPPSLPLDFSWIEDSGVDLRGWVAESQRGTITGTVSGIQDGFQKVIGFANTTAQYWAEAESDGTFVSPAMKPGTYKVTLYKQELEVATDSVTVTAGTTRHIDLQAQADPDVFWRLGDRDGTPAGFLNADKVIEMHPSDVRMSDWNVGAFILGTSAPEIDIPCYHWQDNSSLEIEFELTPAQVVDSTVRIGFTAAYAGARPRIRINGLDKSGKPSTQPDSRSLTIGTYRGNNKTYSYGIPKRHLVAGTNTLRIDPVSGAGSSGFLSPGYSLDFIEWDGPKPARPKTLAGLRVKANDVQVKLEWNPLPSATHYIVERSIEADGPYTRLTSNLGPARFLDPTVVIGKTYWYQVTALNDAGSVTSVITSSVPSPLDKPRVWTDIKGKTLEAEFVRIVGDKLHLKMNNGRVRSLPLSSFIRDDQQLVLKTTARTPRTWTDSTGNFTLDDAVFEGLDKEGMLTLGTAGGFKRLALNRLSRGDQQLVGHLAELKISKSRSVRSEGK